ncbi:TetR/AcrR family transcriptional regulator C-terminal domain-containing protein [Nonomuraea sp. NPDC003804]|uniref:TetR/AcrR family transcriptional regulator C-terminal domain-containing protein n=1 Tax=Nonomuraea sp. NPDC003804 TaxID=3154547 RepID=UPI0033B294BD
MTEPPRPGKLRPRRTPVALWEEPASEPRLDRAEIVRAALELIEGEGLDGFSMRGLATELNIKSPSLYWHVRSKDELFELLIDAVLGECRLPTQEEGEWTDRLADVARELRRVLLAHPEATRLLTGRVPLGPNWLRLAEHVIGTLRWAGFDNRLASHCYLVLIYFAIGFASQEIAFGRGGDGPARLAEMHEYVRSLPADRFPNLVAVTEGFTERGLTDRFELGLRGIISGFAAELAKAPAGND